MFDGHHAFANGCCVQSSTSALHPGHSLVHVGMAEAHAVPRFVHSVVQRGVALSDDCALWVAGRGRVSRLRQEALPSMQACTVRQAVTLSRAITVL